jgi:hypothetical protein
MMLDVDFWLCTDFRSRMLTTHLGPGKELGHVPPHVELPVERVVHEMHVDILVVYDSFDRQFNMWRNVAKFFARTEVRRINEAHMDLVFRFAAREVHRCRDGACCALKKGQRSFDNHPRSPILLPRDRAGSARLQHRGHHHHDPRDEQPVHGV